MSARCVVRPRQWQRYDLWLRRRHDDNGVSHRWARRVEETNGEDAREKEKDMGREGGREREREENEEGGGSPRTTRQGLDCIPETVLLKETGEPSQTTVEVE